MTDEQWRRANELMEERRSIIQSLTAWKSVVSKTDLVTKGLSLAVLEHCSDKAWEAYREACITHLKARIAEIETEFAKV